jgi:endogenous inhibitor of DNA gyrase (YacG/DUF329 family)
MDYRFPMRRKCPSCGRAVEVVAPDSYQPFCSERCRLADLGKWLDGAYRISAPLAEEDLDQGMLPDDGDGDAEPKGRN